MKFDAKEIGYPTALIVIICLVVTALLVGTNSLTEGRIAELNQKAADEAKATVLPAADGFETKTINVNGKDIEYYEATNGAGYVFYDATKGYGGPVGIMVGIDMDRNLTGLVVKDCNETPGLGAKSTAAGFDQDKGYVGPIPASNEYKIVKTGRSAEGEIDAISGATITSTSVVTSVNEIVQAYNELTGGAK